MANRPGYSLLEVLIAFAIMMTVLAVLLPAQIGLSQRGAQAEAKLAAHEYALSVMDTVGVSRKPGLGRMTEDYRDWIVEIEVNRGAQEGLAQVVIRVLSSSGEELSVLTAQKRWTF